MLYIVFILTKKIHESNIVAEQDFEKKKEWKCKGWNW
jgi:hypothetical protein